MPIHELVPPSPIVVASPGPRGHVGCSGARRMSDTDLGEPAACGGVEDPWGALPRAARDGGAGGRVPCALEGALRQLAVVWRALHGVSGEARRRRPPRARPAPGRGLHSDEHRAGAALDD